MNNFSEILEGRNRTSHDSGALLSHEIQDYAKKMSKKLPEEVSKILYVLQKYSITSKEDVEVIKSASNSELSDIATQYNIDINELKDLKKQISKIGANIRLLPMYMSKKEREELELGKLAMDDLTMDLESSKGRNAVVKQYAPLVYKIANQYMGRVNLDKSEIISAGMEGLTFAMNTYKKPVATKDVENEEDRDKAENARRSSFKSYASYMIKYKILSEVYNNASTIKVNYYGQKKAAERGESTNLTQSLDRIVGKDDEEFSQDHQASLAVNDQPSEEKQQQKWQKLIDLLGKEFSRRDVVVFLKYFGLGGEKQEKGKDIAKEFNMTPAMVTHIVTKKIIPFIKQDTDMMDILSEIMDIYNESIITNYSYMSADEIREMLLADDVYLLLEEINRWREPQILIKAIKNSVIDDSIYDILDEMAENSNNWKSNNTKIVKEFLSNLYPTKSFARANESVIIEEFTNIANLYKKYTK